VDFSLLPFDRFFAAVSGADEANLDSLARRIFGFIYIFGGLPRRRAPLRVKWGTATRRVSPTPYQQDGAW
jgi:hypothetical protein